MTTNEEKDVELVEQEEKDTELETSEEQVEEGEQFGLVLCGSLPRCYRSKS